MSTPSPSADRNLIFGLLALQMDFLTSEQLLDALHAWMRCKTTPVGEILRERGLLNDRRLDLLQGMVEEHIAQHGGDARASLAALRVEESIRQDLNRLDDDDVQASVASLSSSPPASPGPGTKQGASDDSVASPVTAEPAATASTTVRFRRLRDHAKGGLGEVFVALDEELHREVALKEIQDRFADHAGARGRFLREAEITGKLEHPGVVPVYGLGCYPDGRPFYAMRLIRGESLHEAIHRFNKADDDPRRDPGERGLALRELLGRFVAVCNAVGYAHARGVIHRDLKPANVMLGEYGETLVVDWGLARALAQPESEETCAERPVRLSEASDTAPTEMGQMVGTPAYMPPEQAVGELDRVGPASDGFALGAMLYAVLTGQPPYTGTKAEVQRLAQRAEVVPARQRKRSVPAALEAVCGKALAKKPEDRYVSARALAEEVLRWLGDEPVQAYREPLADRLRRWGRRNRSVVSAGVVLLAAGVVGLCLGLWAVERERERTKEAARLAEEQKDKAQQAEKETLEDYRASTDDAIEQLIGSKPVLGAQEKTYLQKTLKRWQVFAARSGGDERSRAIRAEGQFRVANLRSRLGQIEAAEAGYREALAIRQKLADEFLAVPEYRYDLAGTHHNLGVLLHNQNKDAQAIDLYHKALDIQQKLVEDYPAVPTYRMDLARHYNNLGLLLAGQNQGENATTQYQKALAIQRKLADEFPAVPEYRQDLAGTHRNLGVLLKNQNQWEKAAEQHHKALAIMQKLANEFPAVTKYRKQLAGTHNNLGALLQNQNQWEKAAEQFDKALAIGQKLADEFPAMPEYRNDLAGTHNNLGALLQNQKQGEKAVEQYQKALAIGQKLADEFPVMPAYLKDLADTHNNLGLLLMAQYQLEKAAEQHHKALAIMQKLADDFPVVLEYRKNLSNTHSNLALLLAGQNQGKKAAEQYQKALAIGQKLADDFPAVSEYHQNVARTHGSLGNLLEGQNHWEKAAEQYDKALAIFQKLADECPAVPEYCKDLASTHNNLGNMLRHQNQWEKAAEHFFKALTIKQKLADEFPVVPAYRQDLAGTHNNLGTLLASQNQGAKAAEQYHKALAIQQKLADEFPVLPDYRRDLAATHVNLGSLLAAQNQEVKAVEYYQKALAIGQKLADDFPSVTTYQVHLGASCCNYGNLLRGSGKPADSLPWYDKATRTLTRVHEQAPRVVTPQLFLRNSYHGRALAHDLLGNHAKAVKDWNQAIELSPLQEQPQYRARRVSSRVRAGRVASAVVEVVELAKVHKWSADQWYDFACIYALASGKIADKKREYADRAMELLHQAVKAGFKDAAHLAKDKDLNVLRERDDFKKLLASLAKAKEKGPVGVPEKK